MTDRSSGSTTDAIYLQQLEERIRARDGRLVTDTAAVLSTPEGRRWVRWLLTLCHFYAELPRTAPEIFIASGERNIAVRVLRELAQHELLYAALEAEARELIQQEAAEDAAFETYRRRVRATTNPDDEENEP
jgi:hypothetical protein